jgi:hypothetical protein
MEATVSCQTCNHIYGHASSCPWFLDEVQGENDELKQRIAELETAIEAAASWIEKTQYRVSDDEHHRFAAHIRKTIAESGKQ